MEAAYRFFDNDKVGPQAILAPHVRATIQRVGRSETAILVQDTTELDLTRPAQQVEGSGPLEFEPRRGLFHHPLLAFDGRGLCLGKLWEQNWAREKIERGRSASEKQQACRAKPIEEKESMRWLEGLRAARQVAEICPQPRCVMAADSESDVYEIFAEPRHTSHGGQLELLIRAADNRRVEHRHKSS